ncbi:MAG: hypothetical protein RL215_3487 [Planctomycetota bacterium]
MDLRWEFLAAVECHPAEDVVGFFVEGLCSAVGILDQGDIEVDGDFISATKQFGDEELHAFEPEGVSITEDEVPGFFDGVGGCPLDVFSSGAADGGDSGEFVGM